MKEILQKPIQFLKGVGPKRAAVLQKLNIFTCEDVLYHFPREYQDRSTITPVNDLKYGERVTVLGKVLYSQENNIRKGLKVAKIAIDDGCGVVQGVWFNQSYVLKQFPTGSEILITGKVDKIYQGINQIQVSDYEQIQDQQEVLQGKNIVPIYPLTEGIRPKTLRNVIVRVLEELGEIKEFIPSEILKKYRLSPWLTSLQFVHSPNNLAEAKQGRRRLIFEELFLLQLFLLQKKQKITRKNKSYHYSPGESKLVQLFIQQLPFSPTEAQQKVWQEIEQDMNSPYSMQRLLQGDVGCGKTLVAVLTLLKAVADGYQGVIMVPTEILAEQHYIGIRNWLEPLGVSVVLLTGKQKKAQKEATLQSIQAGKASIIIGTHALIQSGVTFHSLAVVVIDEQHRFGVRQRLALQNKGKQPDLLVMTATPIPRSLALTLYGDLNLSVIDSLPSGRQPIRTYAVTTKSQKDVYRLIINEVKKKRQAYIVCPLVEESQVLDVQAAVDLATELQQGVFSQIRVGLLHGRMKSEEKEKIMSEFHLGKIDVLVSTTVIEVGVDVPNATVMAIVDAQRFGLAQLHQLRGRVGRGPYPSYCLLLSDTKTEESQKRLSAMVDSSDGFTLAEEDLRLRGPGEFLGVKQSGLPNFKIADIVKDYKAMECARQEAINLITKDPELTLAENRLLAEELKRRYSLNSLMLGSG